jgi:hypothetical protein
MHLHVSLNITHHNSLTNQYQFINHSIQKLTVFWNMMPCNLVDTVVGLTKEQGGGSAAWPAHSSLSRSKLRQSQPPF